MSLFGSQTEMLKQLFVVLGGIKCWNYFLRETTAGRSDCAASHSCYYSKVVRLGSIVPV